MKKLKKKKAVRKFSTGAFRDNDTQKINIIGSFSPLVLRRFAQFMRDHNIKSGELKRDEANWKKGMPVQSYMESKARHWLETWITFEGYENFDIEELLCADLFNTMGHLHEILVEKLQKKKEKEYLQKLTNKINPLMTKSKRKKKQKTQTHIIENTYEGLNKKEKLSNYFTSTQIEKILNGQLSCKQIEKIVKGKKK